LELPGNLLINIYKENAMKTKQKKQFRLYDIYRYIVTGETSQIKGIHSYDCNKDGSIITVDYDNFVVYTYVASTEDELKNVVTIINKQLGNCSTNRKRRRVSRVSQ
jgi:hypothetical protein